jgi:CRP-like cAMP-binding protein
LGRLPKFSEDNQVYQNRLLSAISERHGAFLKDRLNCVAYSHGDTFGESGNSIDELFFPCLGLVSVVVDLQNGERIEAAMVGREGMIGGAAALGALTHVSTSIGQIPGSGLSMRAADLIEIATDDESIRTLIFGHERFLLAQAQQTAACNARHLISQRLATWLLRACDITGAAELQVTQAFLAQMLGVQRPSISVFAHEMQENGSIEIRRGYVKIRDRSAVAAFACECHARLRVQQVRVFAGSAETDVMDFHASHSPLPVQQL